MLPIFSVPLSFTKGFLVYQDGFVSGIVSVTTTFKLSAFVLPPDILFPMQLYGISNASYFLAASVLNTN